MKSTPPESGRRGAKPPGFTLVETMMALVVGMLLMAAVGSILVMSVRLVNKNQQINAAVSNTRSVQEHLNSELAKAISMDTPKLNPNRPQFSNASTTTPTRYATMIYRVPIGSQGTLAADITNTSLNTPVVVNLPADCTPKIGDYLMMDSPNLDKGILITGVSGNTLTLASDIHDGSDPTDQSLTSVTAGTLVHIQREREYDVILPPLPIVAPTTELHWYESTADVGAVPTKYTVLSTHVDAHSPYLFTQIPADVGGVFAAEPSVSWQFSYVASGTGAYSQDGGGQNVKSFYQTNYAEGLILPKSGDPLSATSILGGGPTAFSSSTTTTLGTSTSVSSTTTLGTSTTKVSSTSTLGTSTTKISSTTTLGTSTSKSSTTTLGTSTSKTTTTTLGTSTLGTSTSKTTTTNGTSSTTTTLGTSTTKISSTTTLGTSTSKSTTTLGTSTSKSTTTLGTSTSKSTTTTTLGTTTLGTSTSKSSTTTLGTSTTLHSTTTLGTSSSKSTTTTTTTTTTIPFDG